MKCIPLTQGQVALVDDTDFERLSKHQWKAARDNEGKFYAFTKCDGHAQQMHRLVTGTTDAKLVKHNDGNNLNNQRINLCVATEAESARKRKATKARWVNKVGKEYLRKRLQERRAKDWAGVLRRGREWKKANPEKVMATRLKGVPHKAEYDKDYYLKNRDRIRKRTLRWAKSNPHRTQGYALKRNALKAAATINLRGIRDFIARVKVKKKVRCYYCQQFTPTFGCHFDHIVPLARGGSHSADNLCVTCPCCNGTKSDKPLRAFVRLLTRSQLVMPI